MRYRREIVPGATYFFTVNLQDRQSHLLVERIDALRKAIVQVKTLHPFGINAFVVLPDHLHAIWTLPAADADYCLRWSLIKAGFSRSVPKKETSEASPQTDQ